MNWLWMGCCKHCEVSSCCVLLILVTTFIFIFFRLCLFYNIHLCLANYQLKGEIFNMVLKNSLSNTVKMVWSIGQNVRKQEIEQLLNEVKTKMERFALKLNDKKLHASFRLTSR